MNNNKEKKRNIVREIREELIGILRTKKHIRIPKSNYRIIVLTEILYQRDEQLAFRDSCFISFPWKKVYLMK